MFLASTPNEDITLLEAAVTGLLGYAVVFLGLILLMIVVMLLGKALMGATKKKEQPAAAPIAAEPAAKELAPGSAGELKLHDVDPKTAAMLMAIVADKLGKPLNELRFISIKEDK